MTPALQPFDHLIYCGSDIFDRIVQIKSWSPASHIEIYIAPGISWASRNGKGVNAYPYRSTDLVAVLRPKTPLAWPKVEEWFNETARGQGYDWLGLLCFTLAVKQGSPDKMFCSEFATNLDREAGFNPFHPSWPADKVSPGMFLQSAMFDWIWYDKTKLS